MTPERLETLRFLAKWKTATSGDLADYNRLSYPAARARLRRCKRDGLVKAEVGRLAKPKRGHGSDPLIWSLTKKGMERLHYFEAHPEKVSYRTRHP